MKLFLVIFLIYCSTPCRTQTLCDILGSSSGEEITEHCLHQLQIVCNNASLLWRMFDASSKYPNTGISYSNNKDFGNFDQCVDTHYESIDGTVKGKYCGLSVAVINLFFQPLPNPYKLDVKARSLAEVATVDHRDLQSLQRDLMDQISLSLLSVCVPDKCTPQEVGKFFLWGNIAIENIPLVNFVDTVPCVTKDSNSEFEWSDIVFIAFLSIIAFFVVWGTAYEYVLQRYDRAPDHPILVSFSLISNGRKLLHISHKKNPEQIQCLNGMRFVSIAWVIAGHTFIAAENVALINYKEILAFIDDIWVAYATSAPMAVDTFFFLSGFLFAFGFFKSAFKMSPLRQVFSIPMMIIHRYLRLTPALAVLYFACITIFKFLGIGPLWNYVSQVMGEQCTKHWWSFFLYVQNYVNYKDMCLNHTWYLSADMQMFILAPLVLIPLAYLMKNKKTNLAIYSLLGLIFVCIVFPIGIRFADETIDNVYETHSRFNNYLIGVLLGVIMRTPRFQKFPFHKLVNLAVWCFVLVITVLWNIYYHHVVRVYNHTSDTLFYSLYRPVWCFSLAWMVYSCHHGYGGPINWFLSLPMFQVGARLSYCMYLLHGVIQFYWVGLVRTQFYWSHYTIFYLFCGHAIVTMLLSVVWSLAFESPMIAVEKCIFGGGGGGGGGKKPLPKTEIPKEVKEGQSST